MSVVPAENWGQFEIVFNGTLVATGNPLPVTIVGGGGGGGGNVNLASVGGAAYGLGQGLAAASMPVVLASNAGLPAGTNVIGHVIVDSGSLVLSAGTNVIGHTIVDSAVLAIGTNSIGNVATLTALTNFGTAATLPAVTSVGTVSTITNFGTTATLPTVTNVGTVASITNVATITALPSIPTGANIIGAVTPAPRTSGGLLLSSTIIPNNTTAVVAKGSAGQVYHIEGFNNSATVAYLKVYNATSATAGSGTPVMRYMIPANSGFSLAYETGDAYGTGITFIVTTGITDADTTAPAANTIIINIHYK